MYAFSATAFFAAAACLIFVPAVAGPILWVSLAFAAGIIMRYLVLGIVCRLPRREAAGEVVRVPSMVFLIPCLNELPSLQKTVPAMRQLSYPGRLLFCYVCESASTDGTVEYVRELAQQDPRVVLMVKPTPPSGRGAAIRYGIGQAREADVIAFLDADHVLDQSSLEEVGRAFGRSDPPAVLQGACASLNEFCTPLTRLLSIERRWMEAIELDAGPRLGGASFFGGGQGFFRSALLKDERFSIDDSMILDDIDLSCRLVLHGCRVRFVPRVATRSLQPERVSEFLDQRFRWMRGWVQVAAKCLLPVFRHPGTPLAVRMDLLRLVLLPYSGAVLYAMFAVAGAALVTGYPCGVPTWAVAASLLWPLLLGLQPYLAGTGRGGLKEIPLVLLGIPLLFLVYSSLCAASLVDMYALRRRVRYSKTDKQF